MMKRACVNPVDRPEFEEVLRDLAARCATLPGVLIAADETWREVRPVSNEYEWLIEACGGATEIGRQAAAAIGELSERPEPFALMIEPGLALLAAPILQRRRCNGFVAAVCATTSLLEAAALNHVSTRTGLLVEALRSTLTERPLPAPDSCPNVLPVFAWWLHDLCALHDAGGQLHSFGRQLSDAYEELSLLHKLGRNMNVVRKPQEFLELTCAELLEVMPFRWIGVKLLEGESAGLKAACRHLAGPLFYHGELERDSRDVAEMIDRFIHARESADSVVIERNTPRCDANLSALAASLVVQPIADPSGAIFGALVAADKLADRGQITSFDQKLLDATAEHIRIFLDNVALYEQMEQMFLGTLEALTASIDAKDRYTCGHSRRVAHLSRALALMIGQERSPCSSGAGVTVAIPDPDRVHIAGLVHDVGKIGVPEAVLCKPGRLTDDEFDLIKRHPEIGVRILRDIPNFEDIIPGVMSHHERWDGGGYPQGLKGERIPLLGRIIALADAFDAMSSTRTYRPAMSRPEVLAEMHRGAGTQFDPDLVGQFLSLDFSTYDALMAAEAADGGWLMADGSAHSSIPHRQPARKEAA